MPQLTVNHLKNYLFSHALHHKSAPYHPATIGLAKNMVKNVKQWLDNQKGGSSFLSILSDFLCKYRNIQRTTTGCTPAKLLFGLVPVGTLHYNVSIDEEGTC